MDLEAAAIGADFDGIDSGMGDGSASATCERFAPDLPSVLEPGVRGVDNQFATSILSSFEDGLDPVGCPGAQTRGCLDWLLHEDLRAGRLLLSVEVRGVDSFEHDPAVEVAVYAVRVPGGGPPALDEDSLAPGQTLETVATLAPPSPGTRPTCTNVEPSFAERAATRRSHMQVRSRPAPIAARRPAMSSW